MKYQLCLETDHDPRYFIVNNERRRRSIRYSLEMLFKKFENLEYNIYIDEQYIILCEFDSIEEIEELLL